MPFIDPEAMIEVAPLAGWSGRCFHSTNMTFGQWEIAAGATDLHRHHHEQEEVWNVVSGAMILVIDGTEHRLEAGDAAAVPANVPHAARVIGACRAIVVDYPLRVELPTRHGG